MSAPSDIRPPRFTSRLTQHLAAAALIAVLAVVNVRGWLFQEIIPRQDFAGYAAVAQHVRDSFLRFGAVPSWDPKWFAGTSNFLSNLKEYVALPLVLLAGPVHGLVLTILLAKIAGPLALYALFVRELRAPLAGLVAAYAYGFGPCANHVTERLDAALSYVLVPLVLLAALDLARRRRPVAAALLGVLLACQFAVNYMQASVCLGMLLLLALLRPWEPVGGRTGVLIAIGTSVFLVFAGSQIAWLVADGPNHTFFSRSHLAFGQARFSVYSPFFLLNRANWMGGWLAAHVPPDADPGDETDVFYLGVPLLLVCVAGWFTVRHRPILRRWYQVGFLLLLLQYAMSLGTRSFVWQLVASFHGSDAFTATIARVFTAAAVIVGMRGVVLLVRARSGVDARARHRAELWLGAGIVLALASQPLFELAARTIPGLAGVRSPMKFFDLVPFSASLVFGVSLVGISAAVRDPRRWRVVAAAVALLVVLDFWPSTYPFFAGTSPRELTELDTALQALPGEDGTVRVLGMSSKGWLLTGPIVSLLLMNSEAGGARSWLPWQAGPHWANLVSTDLRLHRGPQCLPWRPEVSCNFLALARIKYIVDVPPSPQPLGPPWTVRAAGPRFRLWERPDVMPMAYGVRGYAIFVGGEDDIGDLIDEAFPRLAVVSAGASLRNVPADVVAGAAAIRYGAGTARADDAEPGVVAARIVGPSVGRNERWESLLRGADRPLLDVRYSRPRPEQIVLETDAGGEPALIHVAESYHPWWTARVDGRPSPVVRAQRSFMATLVEPGSHRVELRFVPPLALRLADGATAIGWGVLAVGALAWGAATARRAVQTRGR